MEVSNRLHTAVTSIRYHLREGLDGKGRHRHGAEVKKSCAYQELNSGNYI
jgi:hypothetical protein